MHEIDFEQIDQRKNTKLEGENPPPQCLYHFTTEENWRKIQADGVLRMQEDGDTGVWGIYTIDIPNFLTDWTDASKGQLFDLFHRKSNRDNSPIVLIQIPLQPQMQKYTNVRNIDRLYAALQSDSTERAYSNNGTWEFNQADGYTLKHGVTMSEYLGEPKKGAVEYIIKYDIPAGCAVKVGELPNDKLHVGNPELEELLKTYLNAEPAPVIPFGDSVPYSKLLNIQSSNPQPKIGHTPYRRTSKFGKPLLIDSNALLNPSTNLLKSLTDNAEAGDQK